MTLTRSQGVRVQLTWEGKVVPMDWEFRINATPIDGPRPSGSRSSSDGTSRTIYLETGRHRLSFGMNAGYRPIPDREVNVLQGEITDVVVELERKK